MEETRATPRKVREPEPKLCFLSMMNAEQYKCPMHDCMAWNSNPKYPGCLLTQAVNSISYNLVMMMKGR